MALLRRQFLKHSSLLATAAFLSPKALLAQHNGKPLVGLQLYSVRDDMKKDPAGTLEAIAKMGYKYIEHANYIDDKFYGYTPKEFRSLLNNLGLKMPTGHTVLSLKHWDAANKQLTDTWKKTIDDAAYMGQEIVITPSMEKSVRQDYDSFMAFLQIFNNSAQLCKASGMLFGYHNHDFEFKEKLMDFPLYDLMLMHTDANAVKQQLDTGNMYMGGASAVDYLNKYPGRFYSFHVKDVVKASTTGAAYKSCIIGKGLAPTQEALKVGMEQGTIKHFIIEQEEYDACAPLDCMKQNLAVLNSWGY